MKASPPSPKQTPPRRNGAAPQPGAAPRPSGARQTAPRSQPPQRQRHLAEAGAEPAIPTPPSPQRATFLWSFVYAWNGLVHALRTQRNARVHAAIGSAAILLGILLHISPVEFAMVFVAITGVFIAEMFNTVAEACVDLATQEYHPLARIAKDVAAGAVLANAILSVIIGCFIFLPHLWPLVLRLFGH